MDFRQYDNALGRFLNPDRLAELAFDQTSYRYAYNNPIFYKDPSGLYEVDANGNIKITDADEIKKFMGYLNHNQKASVNDMAEHIFNVDNGYAYELQEVVVVGRSKSSYDKAANNIYNQVQNSLNKISSFSGNVSIGNHEINDFDKGFIGADPSNMNSASAWTGYAGLHLSKTESLLKYVGATDDVLKVTKSLGTKLGVAGVVFTVLEDFKDDKQGTGTVVKAAIGTLSVIFPGAGLAYAIIDLSVGVATGTTLTDRIANGVEESLKD